ALHESMVADYFPPDCATDVPTEFASVTFTAPIALVSPVNVNGMVSEKAPPFARPGALPWSNHCAPAGASETVNCVPFNCAPPDAVKVTLAVVRSRGVELASRNT